MLTLPLPLWVYFGNQNVSMICVVFRISVADPVMLVALGSGIDFVIDIRVADPVS